MAAMAAATADMEAGVMAAMEAAMASSEVVPTHSRPSKRCVRRAAVKLMKSEINNGLYHSGLCIIDDIWYLVLVVSMFLLRVKRNADYLILNRLTLWRWIICSSTSLL